MYTLVRKDGAVMANYKYQSYNITLTNAKRNNYNAAEEKDKNFIGGIIANARNKQELSLSKLSVILRDYGVVASPSAISKWEMGGSTPSPYQLIALAQALEMDCDLSFFMSNGSKSELNEEGMKKLKDYKADLIATGRYKPEVKKSHIINFVEMPVSNLAVSAGTGAFLDEGNYEIVSFPESSVPEKADFAVRVSGDSMEPVYRDGQIVWIQICDQVRVGEVGVFLYDGEGYIKEYNEQRPAGADLEEFMDSDGILHMQPVMVSYNQNYEPKVISANAGFKVIGRVLK